MVLHAVINWSFLSLFGWDARNHSEQTLFMMNSELIRLEILVKEASKYIETIYQQESLRSPVEHTSFSFIRSFQNVLLPPQSLPPPPAAAAAAAASPTAIMAAAPSSAVQPFTILEPPKRTTSSLGSLALLSRASLPKLVLNATPSPSLAKVEALAGTFSHRFLQS